MLIWSTSKSWTQRHLPVFRKAVFGQTTVREGGSLMPRWTRMTKVQSLVYGATLNKPSRTKRDLEITPAEKPMILSGEIHNSLIMYQCKAAYQVH